MRRKLQHHHCLIALGLALASAAACGDDGSTPSTSMEGNQPAGSGGTMNGAGGTEAAAMGGAMTGTSGSNGAGEATGMGGTMVDTGASGSANGDSGAAGASMDPECTTGDTDTDGDGIPDCVDGCSEDPNKIAPGECGCGQLDGDIDLDGTLNCNEECPGDPLKTEPGACGCGFPDVDSDTDGTLDCDDDCPFDDTHIVVGTCGCGAEDDLPLCLRHRYSFTGTGAVAEDSAGDADGAIINATLAGNGTLVLAGVATDQYVNLPAGIISRLGVSATLEVWTTWTGAGLPWQRIFDFGSSDGPAGQQGPNGVTYLFLTPTNSINSDLRVAYTNAGPPQERVVNAPTPLPFTVSVHVAIVIDGPAAQMTMYQNGALIGTVETLDTTLARMNDVNNWLGRSQFIADEEYQGVLDEVRIYSAVRSAAQIAADVAAGPNALPDE